MALDEARSLKDKSIQLYLDNLTAKTTNKPIIEEEEEKVKNRGSYIEGSFQQLLLNEKIF